MQTIPTVNDVFELANQIGVPLPDRLRQSDDWTAVLHELAHWAVKPDSYIQCYLDKIQPYAPAVPLCMNPDAEIVMAWDSRPTVRWPNGEERQISSTAVSLYCLDPTPDEFGARAWGLQVLDYLGWPHPKDCAKAGDEWWEEVGSAQYNPDMLTSDEHPISTNGIEQLAFMGIDVAQGILRPQVEVDFDGRWIRVSRAGEVVWQQDVFAGVEVVAWETPMPDDIRYKPVLLDDLLALADAS